MISKEEIQKLAELSRIELSDAEMESLGKDISSILEYVGQIEAAGAPEVHGEKVVPLNHNVMRADVAYTDDNHLRMAREDIVKAFPKEEKGYNVVRKIIQKDE